MEFIEFETVKGEKISINKEKVVAVTPIRGPDDEATIIMYGEREDCFSAVKGKYADVMSKLSELEGN